MLGSCAKKAGVDTIQFIAHRDVEWSVCGAFGVTYLNIEIVGMKFDGRYACGSKNAGAGFKAGWDASQDCHCDERLLHLNCKGNGYPPNF